MEMIRTSEPSNLNTDYGNDEIVNSVDNCCNDITEQFGGSTMGESIQVESIPDVAGYQRVTPVPHPALIGINMAPIATFMTGYRDCAAEAIRFLIEEEHLSPDDPLVLGLKLHLQEQQNCFNFGHVFYQQEPISGPGRLNDSGISLQEDLDGHISQTVLTETMDSRTLSSSDVLSYEPDTLQRSSSTEMLTANQILDIASQHQNNSIISGLAEEILLLLEESDEDLSQNDDIDEIIEQ